VGLAGQRRSSASRLDGLRHALDDLGRERLRAELEAAQGQRGDDDVVAHLTQLIDAVLQRCHHLALQGLAAARVPWEGRHQVGVKVQL